MSKWKEINKYLDNSKFFNFKHGGPSGDSYYHVYELYNRRFRVVVTMKPITMVTWHRREGMYMANVYINERYETLGCGLEKIYDELPNEVKQDLAYHLDLFG